MKSNFLIQFKDLDRKQILSYGKNLLIGQIGWFLLAGGLATSAIALREFAKQKITIEMFNNFDNLKNILCKIMGMSNMTDTHILFEEVSKKLEITRIVSAVATGVFAIGAIGVAIYGITRRPDMYEIKVYNRDNPNPKNPADINRGFRKEDIKEIQSVINPIFVPLVCLTGVSVGVLLCTFTTQDFLPEMYSNLITHKFIEPSNTTMYIALIVGGGLVITGLTLTIIQGVKNLQEQAKKQELPDLF